MKGKRIVAALAVAAGIAGGVGGVSSASAAAPPATLTASVQIFTVNADAYNMATYGGLVSKPANWADCIGYPTSQKTAPLLSIPGVATASALTARCSVSGTDQTAAGVSNIGRVSVLGGKVVLTAVRSQCLSDAAGNTTVGSSIGTLNGVPVNTGPVNVVLPGLLEVHLDQNTQTPATGLNFFDPVSIQSIGASVVIPPMTSTVLGRTRTTPGFTLIVGECHIDGNSLND